MGGAQRYPSIAVREVDGFLEGLNPRAALDISPSRCCRASLNVNVNMLHHADAGDHVATEVGAPGDRRRLRNAAGILHVESFGHGQRALIVTLGASIETSVACTTRMFYCTIEMMSPNAS
jgi:hypothetical protein